MWRSCSNHLSAPLGADAVSLETIMGRGFQLLIDWASPDEGVNVVTGTVCCCNHRDYKSFSELSSKQTYSLITGVLTLSAVHAAAARNKKDKGTHIL